MSNNKPNNSGDGELAMIVFGGVVAGFGGYQMARHLAPDSLPLWLLGKLAHMAGQPVTPQVEAIMAGALAAALGIAVVMILMDYAQKGKRRRAAMKTRRDARDLEDADRELDAKQGRTGNIDLKARRAVAGTYERPERQPGQVTPGFIGACVIGFGLLTFLAAHFLL